MGVDFYTCRNCDETFPDCGDFRSCEYCGRFYCSPECADLQYLTSEDADEENDNKNCVICRKEIPDVPSIYEALLKHFNITEEQAFNIWRADRKS